MKKYIVAIIIALVTCVQMYTYGTSQAITPRDIDIPIPQRLTSASQIGQIAPWGINKSKLTNIPATLNQNVAQVAMGDHHALALTNDGKVVGWGVNLSGELTLPANLNSVVSISVGITHSVALRSNGNVVMWGKAASLVLSPTVTLPTDVVQIAAGSRHTVLLRQNGKVVVTGGLASQRAVPADVNNRTVVAVAAGDDVSLALTSNGEVFAWGKSMTIPNAAKTNIVRIFAQQNIYAALRSDGTLQIWGDVATIIPDSSSTLLSNATSGCPCVLMPNAISIRGVEAAEWGLAVITRTSQIVTMTRTGFSVPATIPDRALTLGMFPSHAAGVAITRIDVTAPTDTTPTRASLAIPPLDRINPPGKLSVWGGSNLIRTVPVSATTSIVQVVAGANHIVALRNDGRIVAWGNNDFGQINVPADLLVTRDATSPLRVVMLAAGANHTLALRANGKVLAWGDNRFGQITGTSNWANVTQIAAGARHSVALLNDNSLVSTGNNTYGQQNIPKLKGIIKITAAANHTVALLSNGNMIAWGRNQYGQTTIPVTMRGVDVRAMADNTLILQPDGKVVVLGSNLFDQTVVPEEYFQRIGAGSYHVMAITKSGAVRAWGLNSDDQTNVPNNLVSPYVVTGGEDFSVALSLDVATQATNTATPTTIPVTSLPFVPTSAALPPYGEATVWALGDIPAVTDTDISSLTITSDTIGIIHGDNTVTLHQSASISPRPLPSEAQTDVQQLGLGDTFAVVLKRDYSLVLWGSSLPNVPAKYMNNVAEIALNRNHLMVRSIDGSVWSSLFPLEQTIVAKHIAAGPTFATVLLANGTVLVRANNNNEGLLTLPNFSNDVTEIAAGQYHILALQKDGKLLAWGASQNDFGQADVPADALYNVVAIAASDRMSVALLNNAQVVAWGEVPTNTSSQLATIAANNNAVAIATGKGRIAVVTSGASITAGTPTLTLVPSPTAIVIPTVTARPSNNQILPNLVGWFTMDRFESRQEYTGVAARYLCPNPYDCPDSDPNGMVNRAVDFVPARNDEITGNTPINLSNNSFTVAYWMRRDGSGTNDVAFSTGALAKVRQYLTMGVDSENRAYCSFFGDDLRAVVWYEDLNWHHYACTFNQTTRLRQLFRDGQLLAQDVVLSEVKFPSAPIIFGQRYDTMSGFSGSLDEFVIYNRVLTSAELQSYTQLPLQDRIEAVSFDDYALRGISPNRADMLCVQGFACPRVTRDTHNGDALVFTGNERMQFSDTIVKFTNGFTVSYWARSTINNGKNQIAVSQSNGTNMFLSGIYDDHTAFCQLGNTLIKSANTIDNSWHQYACTYNSATDRLTLYIDGLYEDSFVTSDYAGLGLFAIGRPLQNLTNVASLVGSLDDVFIYNIDIPESSIKQIYNMTNPPVPIATSIVTPNLTPSRTFTVVRGATNTPLPRPRKTRLPATATSAVNFYVTNTNTNTSTRTPSFTRSITPTKTIKVSPSITGIPTATYTLTQSPTSNVTRTPLIMTRTMLALRSPTWGAQTLTATYAMQAATNIAATTTSIAAASATNIASTSVAATLTAYPAPPTATSSPTAYPTP